MVANIFGTRTRRAVALISVAIFVAAGASSGLIGTHLMGQVDPNRCNVWVGNEAIPADTLDTIVFGTQGLRVRSDCSIVMEVRENGIPVRRFAHNPTLPAQLSRGFSITDASDTSSRPNGVPGIAVFQRMQVYNPPFTDPAYRQMIMSRFPIDFLRSPMTQAIMGRDGAGFALRQTPMLGLSRRMVAPVRWDGIPTFPNEVRINITPGPDAVRGTEIEILFIRRSNRTIQRRVRFLYEPPIILPFAPEDFSRGRLPATIGRGALAFVYLGTNSDRVQVVGNSRTSPPDISLDSGDFTIARVGWYDGVRVDDSGGASWDNTYIQGFVIQVDPLAFPGDKAVYVNGVRQTFRVPYPAQGDSVLRLPQRIERCQSVNVYSINTRDTEIIMLNSDGLETYNKALPPSGRLLINGVTYQFASNGYRVRVACDAPLGEHRFVLKSLLGKETMTFEVIDAPAMELRVDPVPASAPRNVSLVITKPELAAPRRLTFKIILPENVELSAGEIDRLRARRIGHWDETDHAVVFVEMPYDDEGIIRVNVAVDVPGTGEYTYRATVQTNGPNAEYVDRFGMPPADDEEGDEDDASDGQDPGNDDWYEEPGDENEYPDDEYSGDENPEYPWMNGDGDDSGNGGGDDTGDDSGDYPWLHDPGDDHGAGDDEPSDYPWFTDTPDDEPTDDHPWLTDPSDDPSYWWDLPADEPTDEPSPWWDFSSGSSSSEASYDLPMNEPVYDMPAEPVYDEPSSAITPDEPMDSSTNDDPWYDSEIPMATDSVSLDGTNDVVGIPAATGEQKPSLVNRIISIFKGFFGD